MVVVVVVVVVVIVVVVVRVFRTYDASETLQNELPKSEDLRGMTVQDKVSSSSSSSSSSGSSSQGVPYL